MGGRGSYSYSGGPSKHSSAPLSAYAVAALNSGVASGTTTEAAIARFRERLMDQKVEYSAYVDDSGYVHSLASTGREGSTSVAPIASVAHETGVSTVIHNHPHGGSDGRKWGGPLSEADLSYIASAYSATGGSVRRMVATSNEGTYSAVVRRPVTQSQVHGAAKRANEAVRGKKYQSEISMWRAENDAYTSEFAKIGISDMYAKRPMGTGRMVTQRVGTYEVVGVKTWHTTLITTTRFSRTRRASPTSPRRLRWRATSTGSPTASTSRAACTARATAATSSTSPRS